MRINEADDELACIKIQAPTSPIGLDHLEKMGNLLRGLAELRTRIEKFEVRLIGETPQEPSPKGEILSIDDLENTSESFVRRLGMCENLLSSTMNDIASSIEKLEGVL